MTSRYEVWKRADWDHQSNPVAVTATLDMAMENAKSLSKCSSQYFVLDRNQNPSRVRGFGINGKWLDSKDCKRCNNTGDKDGWDPEPCQACNGTSWKPF